MEDSYFEAPFPHGMGWQSRVSHWLWLVFYLSKSPSMCKHNIIQIHNNVILD